MKIKRDIIFNKEYLDIISYFENKFNMNENEIENLKNLFYMLDRIIGDSIKLKAIEFHSRIRNIELKEEKMVYIVFNIIKECLNNSIYNPDSKLGDEIYGVFDKHYDDLEYFVNDFLNHFDYGFIIDFYKDFLLSFLDTEIVIGNKSNCSYHLSTCKFVPRIDAKRIFFKSKEEAELNGFKKCQTCFGFSW